MSPAVARAAVLDRGRGSCRLRWLRRGAALLVGPRRSLQVPGVPGTQHWVPLLPARAGQDRLVQRVPRLLEVGRDRTEAVSHIGPRLQRRPPLPRGQLDGPPGPEPLLHAEVSEHLRVHHLGEDAECLLDLLVQTGVQDLFWGSFQAGCIVGDEVENVRSPSAGLLAVLGDLEPVAAPLDVPGCEGVSLRIDGLLGAFVVVSGLVRSASFFEARGGLPLLSRFLSQNSQVLRPEALCRARLLSDVVRLYPDLAAVHDFLKQVMLVLLRLTVVAVGPVCLPILGSVVRPILGGMPASVHRGRCLVRDVVHGASLFDRVRRLLVHVVVSVTWSRNAVVVNLLLGGLGAADYFVHPVAQAADSGVAAGTCRLRATLLESILCVVRRCHSGTLGVGRADASHHCFQLDVVQGGTRLGAFLEHVHVLGDFSVLALLLLLGLVERPCRAPLLAWLDPLSFGALHDPLVAGQGLVGLARLRAP